MQQSADAHFSYANFNLAMLKQMNGQDFLPALQNAYALGNSHAGIVLADYYLAQNAQNNDADKMAEAKSIYTGLQRRAISMRN